MSRRRFLGGVSFAALGTFGYARFVEAEWLQTSHVPVSLSGERRPGLKLLHLSDLHASPVVSVDYINRALIRALEWEPDAICLTGDFITTHFDEDRRLTQALRRLAEAAPCHAVLGNHDGGEWARHYGGYADTTIVKALLRDAGVRLLENETVPLKCRDWKLNLVGVSDGWAGEMQPEQAFRPVDKTSPTVLLSHNPDTKETLAKHDWQLLLSGHTHGGQLRVPILGTPFAPVRDKRFVAGLHRWRNRWLHITKGVGTVYGLRINCPPELSFLTLT